MVLTFNQPFRKVWHVLHQVSINSRKGDVESELAVVAPIIEAARLAVGQIRTDHLNEIRSLKAPPDAIRDVLEGVLKLMGQADTSWNSMKKFLGNRGVKVHHASLSEHVHLKLNVVAHKTRIPGHSIHDTW